MQALGQLVNTARSGDELNFSFLLENNEGRLEHSGTQRANLGCSGLLTPDTFLGENARHTEVFDEQTTTYLHPDFQA